METCELPVKAQKLCMTHYARLLRWGDPNHVSPPGRPNEWYGTEFKRCHVCGEVKERTAENWTKKRSSHDGLNSSCRPCSTQHQRNLWRDNPEHMAKLGLTRRLEKFGTTFEWFEQTLVAQNGLCFLCDRPPNGKGGLHIDHDHRTGQVRALLCHSCNVGLGHFRDNLDTLRRAVAYLQTEEHYG